jgi:hypothetical protein
MIAYHCASPPPAPPHACASGSIEWLLAVGAFNLVCALRTYFWCNSQLERWLCRVLCVAGYVLPISMADPVLCAQAFFFFACTAVPFVLNAKLNGWGHALSHVVLGPFVVSILAAASSVPAPYTESSYLLVSTVNDAVNALVAAVAG